MIPEPKLPNGDPPDGDQGFIGLNQLDQPADLLPGEVYEALNARFTNKEMEPRKGISKLNWTNRAGMTGAVPLPFVTIYGAGEYRDAADVVWSFIAADGGVFATRESGEARTVPLPSGETVTSGVTFTQTQQGVVMFRGTEHDELILKNLSDGFTALVQQGNIISGDETENPDDGTEQIQRAEAGEWIGNRLYLLFASETEKDLLAISDFLNATRYSPTRAQGRINTGSSDAAVRLFKFSENTGIVFKENSIYALYGLQGDLSEMVLDDITKEFGCCAPRAVTHVGKDNAEEPSSVWFLSERKGVCTIVATDLGKLRVTSVPVSASAKKIIARVDWRNASLARSDEWDNKYYLALPLDDSTGYGPELVRSAVYAAGVYSVNVIPGQRYRFVKGANEVSLTNGGTTVTATGDFVAASDVVTFNGSGVTSVTATLKRVYQNVCNAILVFDRLRGRWAGYDSGQGLMVKELVRLSYRGERRLMFLGADGFLNCLEELYYDEVCYEQLGSNLTAGNYSGGGASTVAVTSGRQYTWVKGANDTSLTNGSQVLTSSGSFIAAGSSVTLAGTAAAAVTARVRLVSWALSQEWVGMDVTTRGDRCGFSGQKRFKDLQLQVRTWNPAYSVAVKLDGVNEEYAVASVTKDNRDYYEPAHTPRWVRENTNDDHGTEKREDYSVTLRDDTTASGAIVAGVLYFVESSDVTTACSIRYNGVTYTNQTTFTGVAGVATFTVLTGSPRVYGPGNYVLLGANGIDFNAHQDAQEPFRLPMRARGEYCQVRIRSTQGRCVVKGLVVTGVPVERTKGAKA